VRKDRRNPVREKRGGGYPLKKKTEVEKACWTGTRKEQEGQRKPVQREGRFGRDRNPHNPHKRDLLRCWAWRLRG